MFRSTAGKAGRHGRDKDSAVDSRATLSFDFHATAKKFPESLGTSVHEGPLKSKNTFVDGKYSVDRAWKNTYAVLRGHCLCLHPDKSSQNLVVYDHPISIGSALVDIAYDYMKRPNVLRVMTLNFSEFLLEAPSSGQMLEWIRMLQKQGLTYSQEFLKRNFLSSSLKTPKPRSRGRRGQQTVSLDDPPTAKKFQTMTKQDFLQPSNFLERFCSKSPESRKQKVDLASSGGNSENKVKSWREKVTERFKRANSHPGSSIVPNTSASLSLLSPPGQCTQLLDFPDSVGDDQPRSATGCLGVALSRCVPSPSNEHLPLIVETCINIIESQGLNNRGIYRVPGNSAAIALLQAEVEKDPLTLNRSHEKWEDTNAVISLLKLFFRKLPEPLITKDLYLSFIDANHTDDKTKRLLKIKRLVHLLPPHNFETFRQLAAHLHKVATFESTNMMDARNLAIVFGPTLLQPAEDKNMVNMIKDMNDQCQIVESVIMHHKWFFGSWDEDVQVPGNDSMRAAPVTSMESQLIEKAQQHCEMSAAVSSKKNRFASLVPQSSLSKQPRRETEGTAKGMTVYSVESVYCDVESSSDVFETPKNSKLKSPQRSGSSGSRVKSGSPSDKVKGLGASASARLEQCDKLERSSRKKFRGDPCSSRASEKSGADVWGDECRLEESVRDERSLSGDYESSRRCEDGLIVRGRSERDDVERMRHISDDVTDGSDRKMKNRMLRSGRLKPMMRGVECSSADSCFVDCSSEACETTRPSREHSRRHRKPATERNIRNLPSSSLLQPPRIHFRSRSSQKSSKKAQQRQSPQSSPRMSRLSDDATERTADVHCTSYRRNRPPANLRDESNSPNGRSGSEAGWNFKNVRDAVDSLEQSHSGSFERELTLDVHDIHRDNVGSIVSPLIPKTRAERRDKGRVSKDFDADDVFYDDSATGKKLIKVVTLRRRSMSANSLFHKVQLLKVIGSNAKLEEVQGQSFLQFPCKSGLKMNHSSLHLSLHSLRSQHRLEKLFQFDKLPHSPQSPRLSSPTSSQKKSNTNIIKNFFTEIQHHLESRSTPPRTSSEKRNAIKKLVRTCSSGSCFCKDNLSSPSSRDAFGSLSYESSV